MMAGEWRLFAETSSMKGLSRVLKAKTLSIKLLWIVAVIGLLCISCWMSYQLIIQYIHQPSVTKIDAINLLADGDLSEYFEHIHLFSLPGITLCNLNALAGINMSAVEIDWYQYIKTIGKKLHLQPFDELSYKLSHRGYLEHLGPKILSSQNDPKDFFIRCTFSYHLSDRKYPCNNILTTRHFPNIEFSQCFTVSVNWTKHGLNSRALPSSLQLILFLDEVSNDYITGHFDASKNSAGVLVMIHEHNRLPQLGKGFTILPGHDTRISLKNTMYNEKESEGCKLEIDKEYHDWADQLYVHDAFSCFQREKQNLIIQRCGCASSHINVRTDKFDAVDLCGSSLDNMTYCHQQVMCLLNTRLEGNSSMSITCLPHCKEIESSYQVTSSKWPTVTSQSAFYKKHIENRSFAKRFDVYNSSWNDFDRHRNLSLLVSTLKKETLIEDNFVNVEFTLPHTRASVLSKSYQISLSGLISSLGGCLNLWSGISVVILVEVVELIFHLLEANMLQKVHSETKTALG